MFLVSDRKISGFFGASALPIIEINLLIYFWWILDTSGHWYYRAFLLIWNLRWRCDPVSSQKLTSPRLSILKTIINNHHYQICMFSLKHDILTEEREKGPLVVGERNTCGVTAVVGNPGKNLARLLTSW